MLGDRVKGVTPTRRRNARGSGDKLRDELVEAAGRLLEELPGEDALSLRAVAREAGVSAPSVYLHFPDLAAVVREVMRRQFDDLAAALDAAAAQATGPYQELVARSLGYCEYAQAHPGMYRLMFSSVHTVTRDPEDLPGPDIVGVQARLLAECGAPDPMAAATQLWCGLHGLVTLRHTKPLFPWGDRDAQVLALVASLVPATAAHETP